METLLRPTPYTELILANVCNPLIDSHGSLQVICKSWRHCSVTIGSTHYISQFWARCLTDMSWRHAISGTECQHRIC